MYICEKVIVKWTLVSDNLVLCVFQQLLVEIDVSSVVEFSVLEIKNQRYNFA